MYSAVKAHIYVNLELTGRLTLNPWPACREECFRGSVISACEGAWDWWGFVSDEKDDGSTHDVRSVDLRLIKDWVQRKRELVHAKFTASRTCVEVVQIERKVLSATADFLFFFSQAVSRQREVHGGVRSLRRR